MEDTNNRDVTTHAQAQALMQERIGDAHECIVVRPNLKAGSSYFPQKLSDGKTTVESVFANNFLDTCHGMKREELHQTLVLRAKEQKKKSWTGFCHCDTFMTKHTVLFAALRKDDEGGIVPAAFVLLRISDTENPDEKLYLSLDKHKFGEHNLPYDVEARPSEALHEGLYNEANYADDGGGVFAEVQLMCRQKVTPKAHFRTVLFTALRYTHHILSQKDDRHRNMAVEFTPMTYKQDKRKSHKLARYYLIDFPKMVAGQPFEVTAFMDTVTVNNRKTKQKTRVIEDATPNVTVHVTLSM